MRSTEVANRPVPDGKPTGRDIGDRGRYLLQKNPFRIDMTTVADEFDPPQEFIESLLASEVLPKLASFESMVARN